MDRNTKGGTGNKQHDSLLGGLLVCDCGTYIGSDYRKHKQQGKQLNTKRYYCMNKLYEWRDKKNKFPRDINILFRDQRFRFRKKSKRFTIRRFLHYYS